MLYAVIQDNSLVLLTPDHAGAVRAADESAHERYPATVYQLDAHPVHTATESTRPRTLPPTSPVE